MKTINKIKEYKLIIIWLMVLPFIPLFLKYLWLMLLPFVYIKNTKKFLIITVIVSIITPRYDLLTQQNYNDKYQDNKIMNINFLNGNEIYSILYEQNKTIKVGWLERDLSEIIAYNYLSKIKQTNNNYKKASITKSLCYYTQNNCFFYYKEHFKYKAIGSENNIYKGVLNISDYDKKEKVSMNKYITEKSIFNKVIFIPLSKEDLITYDYVWFKNYALEGLESNENECKLLLYGSQNGWKEYTKRLIKKLEHDTDNKCIKSIESYGYMEDNYDSDKKEMLTFLKELPQ